MTALDLSRRAVAAKGWRWLDGMLLTDGRRGRRFAVMGGRWECDDGHRWRPVGTALPDLDDPATLGCIEHGRLPALYGKPLTLRCTSLQLDYWVVEDWRDHEVVGECSGRGEALVRALEAAPPRGEP